MEKDRGNYERATSLFEAGVKADPSHLYLWQAWGCMEADKVRQGWMCQGWIAACVQGCCPSM